MAQRNPDFANPSVCYSLAHALCAATFLVPGRLPRQILRALHPNLTRFGCPVPTTDSEPAHRNPIPPGMLKSISHFTIIPNMSAAENRTVPASAVCDLRRRDRHRKRGIARARCSATKRCTRSTPRSKPWLKAAHGVCTSYTHFVLLCWTSNRECM